MLIQVLYSEHESISSLRNQQPFILSLQKNSSNEMKDLDLS